MDYLHLGNRRRRMAGRCHSLGGTMDELTFDDLHKIIDNVRDNADLEWLRVARDCAVHLASVQVEFTSDDVWAILDELPVATGTPSAMGAVFRDLDRDGIIEKTGQMRPSRRKQAHRMKTVWRAA